MKKVFYFDMDGVLADYHGYVKGNWSLGVKRETYENLPAFAHNVAVLNNLLKHGHTCYILTKAANENVLEGKLVWLAKYVPAMDKKHFIGVLKGRKIDYIREAGVLVDDDERNTKPWIKAGFEAILLNAKGQEIEL